MVRKKQHLPDSCLQTAVKCKRSRKRPHVKGKYRTTDNYQIGIKKGKFFQKKWRGLQVEYINKPKEHMET